MASFRSVNFAPLSHGVSFLPSGEEFLSLWPYAWLEALAPSSASLSTSFVEVAEGLLPSTILVSGPFLLRGLPHLAPTTSGSRDRSPGAF